ncbi:MAG: ABC transporter ATP-binding protein [Planctomycetes bacterium]|nr:ABC transporter ATP-binding protein [Planctomycetota bacterium]
MDTTMTTLEPALSIENLVKTYRDGDGKLSVLRGVDFSIQPGETAAIVGRSGSGKSTILNLAGLLDRPDSGEIWIDGVPAGSMSEQARTSFRGRHIGFVFQNYHMLQDFSIVENVMLGAAVGKGGGFAGKNRAKALQWLERVGLESKAKRRPSQLSGGEQQRVAIARALMPEPKLLLCDEPTGNLDAATGEEVATWLWRAVGEAGMAMVLVTHEKSLAMRAKRIMKLENGVLSDAT